MSVNVVDMGPAEATLRPDDVYEWQYTTTPLGERYELVWPAAPCRDCRGVVVREGPYYDAYIEVQSTMGSTIQWASRQFPTAGAARAWVQNHMVNWPGATSSVV